MKVKQLVATVGERSFAVVMDTGDEAMEKLLAFAGQHHIHAARFTGLGALERVTLGFFDLQRKDYEHIEINEQVELLSLIGNFATFKDEVRLHCHAVVGKRSGHAFGGHLLKAHVRPTLELIVTDTPTHLRRQMDEATGLPLLAP